MDKTFVVKGVNPTGRIVEIRLVAPSAADAKAQAEDVGLQFVVDQAVDDPNGGKPIRSSSATDSD